MTATLTLSPTQGTEISTELTEKEVAAFKSFIEYLYMVSASDMTPDGLASLHKVADVFGVDLAKM